MSYPQGWVRRYDVGSMSTWERTPQGGLRIPATPTRVGVFTYTSPTDGTSRREYRPAEEVFAADSLATLKHAPVTDLHPEADGVRIPVTPENFRDLAVGHVAEDVRAEKDHVAATLLVQDARMIRLIESGERRELSCGYGCTLDMSPGVTQDGQVYDLVQRGIVYNHAAIGPSDWGRQGASVALKFDAGDAIQQMESTVAKETIESKEYEIGSVEWQAASIAQRAKLQSDLATSQGRADALEKKSKETTTAPDPKVFQSAVIRRTVLVSDCARIAKKVGMKFDAAAAAAADESGLLAEAISRLDPSFDPKDAKSSQPGYLMGYFQALTRDLGPDSERTPATETPGALNDGQSPTPSHLPQKPGESKQDSKPSIFSARTDGGGGAGRPGNLGTRQDAGDEADKAREKMVADGKEGWKKPLAAHK